MKTETKLVKFPFQSIQKVTTNSDFCNQITCIKVDALIAFFNLQNFSFNLEWDKKTLLWLFFSLI